LHDIAYTLQVGREAMEVRLAWVVDSLAQLRHRLDDYLEGKNADELYRGEVKRNKEALAVFTADEDLQEAIDAWIAKEKLEKLADLWTKGLAVRWERLYGQTMPRRIALPTYPFAREHHWIPQPEPAQPGIQPGAVLHPLLHQNTSDLQEQRYSSTFTGEEFFLRDHLIQNRKVLPRVALLEMARQAVMRATGHAAAGIRLERLAFVQPVVMENGPMQVHIALELQDGGAIACEIYGEEGLHAKGIATLGDIPAPEVLDVATLQAQCIQHLDAQAIYDTFAQAGVSHGPTFKCLRALHAGQDERGPYALGELQRPDASAAQGTHEWHTNLLDAALQACIGLRLDEASVFRQTAVHFAPEGLQVVGELPARAFVVVREAASSGTAVRKLDLQIVDERGQVCVQLGGVSSPPEPAAPESAAVEPESVGTVLLSPRWQTQEQETPAHGAAWGERHVLLCGDWPALPLESAQVQHLHAPGDVAQRYTGHARQLLQHVQALLQAKPRQPVLVQLVVPLEGEGSELAALGALLKSAAQENPKLVGQVLQLDAGLSGQALAERLQAEAGGAAEVRYRDNQRLVLQLAPLDENTAALADAPALARDGGVYLITGGAGGLGLIFARAIARQVRNTTLVLTGRSALDSARQAQLHTLERDGTRLEYRQVDVSDEAAVQALVNEIARDYGEITGVLHSAGVLRDSFLVKKTAQELDAVFAPKVHGLMHLDRATAGMALEYFVAFASVAGVLGNVGQADYAAANAFMDTYMAGRASQVRQGQRQGRSLSVAWPLWEEGGMRIDAAARKRMWQATGLAPLGSDDGVLALQQALSSGLTQAVVLHGNLQRLNADQSSPEPAPAPVEPARTTAQTRAGDPTELRDKLEAALTQIVSQLLEIGVTSLDRDSEFSEYGFDSIGLTQFGHRINERFGLALAPTVFFEHPTLAKLSAHLAQEHAEALAARFTVSRSGVSTPPPPVVPVDAAAAAPRQGRRKRGRPVAARQAPARPLADEPIAIVGMSGSFPQARDIDTFWENLRDGRDCIEEIPDSRWDWSQLYGDPMTQADKTNAKRAGLIEDMAEFDPLFFGISPAEAQGMDPQQRLLMTHVWRTIEDAGYAASSLAGSDTALFVGTASSGYDVLALSAGGIEGSSATGGAPSIGPNRMSYLLDLHGPSEPVETACSSALVAIHKGVQAIRNGDSRIAIAGGINTLVLPTIQVALSKAGMLCEDGRCKTFSQDANGYVRSEGVGMLMLKRLSDAEADGDRIHGLILGTSQNHGGRANSLTAPNPKAQAELIKTAFLKAGVAPGTVGYIEAHGTGTPLGDPIEIQGLKSAFKDLAEGAVLAEGSCGVGSVKTNIGHLELAAGVAGLIKVLLQMRHKTLVKSLHSEELNPYIDLKGSPFYIVQQARHWEALQDEHGQDLPRRAGVSSFGFGGVNAHVVVEEYVPRTRPRPPAHGPVVIVLSARNGDRLKEQARRLREALQDKAEADLVDVAYTLQVGREAMEFRLAFTVGSLHNLKHKLDAYLEGHPADELYQGDIKHHKEALRLFDSEDDAREAVARWVARGRLDKLAEAWSKGLAVQWALLWEGQAPARISLPTYAFDRTRYWPNVATTGSAGIPVPAPAAAAPVVSAPQGNDLSMRSSDPRTVLAEVLADILRIDVASLDTDKPLQQYGLDSVLGVRLIRAIERRLGMSVSARELAEQPSFEELAARLAPVEKREAIPATDAPAPAGVSAAYAKSPADMLEKFKHGLLDLEQVERLIDEGMLT
ncbi:MAG: SDR family NAD(P)-dependent oxidoreductase, partial [Rhizobacter sp.]